MRNPVVLLLGVWFDGTPREYRTAPSKAAALRWLRLRGWTIKMAAAGAHPREVAYAERTETQEWARVVAAPAVGREEADDAP